MCVKSSWLGDAGMGLQRDGRRVLRKKSTGCGPEPDLVTNSAINNLPPDVDPVITTVTLPSARCVRVPQAQHISLTTDSGLYTSLTEVHCRNSATILMKL